MIRSALSAAGPGWQTWSRTATGYNQKQEKGDRTGLQTAPPDRNAGIPQVRSVRRCFLVEVPVCVTHADKSRRIPDILEQEAALKRNACSRALCALEPAGLSHRAPRSSLISVFLPAQENYAGMCNFRCRLHPPTRPPRPGPGSSIQGQTQKDASPHDCTPEHDIAAYQPNTKTGSRWARGSEPWPGRQG